MCSIRAHYSPVLCEFFQRDRALFGRADKLEFHWINVPFGESLLCVRYRYDENRRVRLKTVEIIVEEKPWQPPFSFKDNDIAPITVAFEETELRAKLHKMRAKWDPIAKVWLVPYRLIRGTELEARIPEEYLNGSRKP